MRKGEEEGSGYRRKDGGPVIALLYLTLTVKFRKAFIKVAFPQVLLFHWTQEGLQDLQQCVIE